MTEFFWQNHGCGDDWTCQRAAACFVDAGHASDAISAEFFLITKSAAPIGHRQNLSADCADFHRFFLGESRLPVRKPKSVKPKTVLLAHRCCFLAFAGTKIIQSGAANASLLLHLDFCDARRMQRENSLHAFAIRDSAHGERFVESASFTANHYARKYLDSFLVSLHNPRMDADAVADLECVGVGFLLFFLDGIDDLVHKNSSQSGRRASNTQGKIATEKNPFSFFAPFQSEVYAGLPSRSLAALKQCDHNI